MWWRILKGRGRGVQQKRDSRRTFARYRDGRREYRFVSPSNLEMPRPTNARTSLGAMLSAVVRQAHAKPHSVRELADVLTCDVRTLQRRCKVAHVSAKASVDFLRCLQLVLNPSGSWDPEGALSEHGADVRTIRGLLARAGLSVTTRPDLETFLSNQGLIVAPDVLKELRDALRQDHRRVTNVQWLQRGEQPARRAMSASVMSDNAV
jgi:hypothetical protein